MFRFKICPINNFIRNPSIFLDTNFSSNFLSEFILRFHLINNKMLFSPFLYHLFPPRLLQLWVYLIGLINKSTFYNALLFWISRRVSKNNYCLISGAWENKKVYTNLKKRKVFFFKSKVALVNIYVFLST